MLLLSHITKEHKVKANITRFEKNEFTCTKKIHSHHFDGKFMLGWN